MAKTKTTKPSPAQRRFLVALSRRVKLPTVGAATIMMVLRNGWAQWAGVWQLEITDKGLAAIGRRAR